jgi:hypothetical protein
MEQTNDITTKAIYDWYRNLSKREKLIVLSIHKMGHSDDFTEIKNVELVLMSGIEPKRRYVENGVPCVDYPSFDEITDVKLFKMWDFIPINDKQGCLTSFILV